MQSILKYYNILSLVIVNEENRWWVEWPQICIFKNHPCVNSLIYVGFIQKSIQFKINEKKSIIFWKKTRTYKDFEEDPFQVLIREGKLYVDKITFYDDDNGLSEEAYMPKRFLLLKGEGKNIIIKNGHERNSRLLDNYDIDYFISMILFILIISLLYFIFI